MKTLLIAFVLTLGLLFAPYLYAQNGVTNTGCKGAIMPDLVLSLDAGPDQHIIYGSGCTLLNGNVAGGISPYDLAWSTGGSFSSSMSTEVCPQVTTTYLLTVTDAAGCMRSDEVTVFVLCDAYSDRVRLCHNTQEICVPMDSVQAHLFHGDILNECEAPISPIPSINLLKIKALDADLISVYLNSNSNKIIIAYTLLFEAWVTLSIQDSTGQEVVVFNHGKRRPGLHSIDILSGNLINGTYYYKLIMDSHGKKQIRAGKLKIIDDSMITHL